MRLFFSELHFRIMSQPDTTAPEIGKRKRAPPPSPFSAWKPGDAAMQSQRKKKQRDKEEKKKEAARIAKFREAKKDNGEQVTKKRPKEKQKS
jgi:hypothetical protein